MNTIFQILIISGFVIICVILILITLYLHSINENLEYVLKGLHILIKKK